ncbi:unnamed protein product [Agarophyton chilense]
MDSSIVDDQLEKSQNNALTGQSIATLSLAITAVSVLCFLIIRQLMRKSILNDDQEMEASDRETAAERPITESELRKTNGEDGQKIYLALKDPFSTKITVFDVTSAKDFYGPGCPYHVFAGKNATHGLATTSTDPEKVTGDLSNLTEAQKDTHMQWHAKYSVKYPIVGYLVPNESPADHETDSVITQDAETKKNA